MTTYSDSIEVIKSIILDFQEVSLKERVVRLLDIKVISGKATICMGVRRSGKSTYMLQIVQALLTQGVALQNILYLNFFDDRLYSLQQEGLGVVLDAYYSLYPEKKNTEKVYCFFDEIQMVPEWEIFVERLMRTENCEVYITGSSARMLSKEIATQLRGRSLSWEMFPFSFQEFLFYKKMGQVDVTSLSTKKQLLIRQAFDEYWQTGGFPEVAGLDQSLRCKIHQEYFSTILFRDLIERYDISHPKAVVDLAHWLVNNTASLYTLNSLTGYLKSLGHKLQKTAVAQYLDWFEDAYFFFTVRIFDASMARSNANPKKVYCIDHALVVSVASGILVNTGHLLENLVFVALRQRYSKIFYYKTQNGREIDFIVKSEHDPILLIQVCESLADPNTRKRELAALNEAMLELNVNRALLVTRYEQSSEELPSGRVEIVPIWRFLLNL